WSNGRAAYRAYRGISGSCLGRHPHNAVDRRKGIWLSPQEQPSGYNSSSEGSPGRRSDIPDTPTRICCNAERVWPYLEHWVRGLRTRSHDYGVRSLGACVGVRRRNATTMSIGEWLSQEVGDKRLAIIG